MKPITASFIETVLDLTCTIQAIPAPTFQEEARAAFFLEQFQRLGLRDVQRDAAGNVLARLPGGGPHLPQTTGAMVYPPAAGRSLVISAHLDTVHPFTTPLTSLRSEDRIVGPGIGDNALGLAAVLGLAQLLVENQVRLPGDLWLAVNVCEEGLGDLRGIQAIVDRFGGAPLAYVVVEGIGLGRVLHRGLGVERYKISVETPGGHSWVNYGDPSAIHELSALVTQLAGIPLPRDPCTTLNVGIIHGGTSVNTIAAQAWLELDLRSEGRRALADLVSQVHDTVRAAQRSNVQVRIERIGKRQAGEIAKSHPLVQLASNVLAELGIEALLDIASTDANLPLSRGYPAICVGITNGNNAHTMEEFILTRPVKHGMEQLYLLATTAWERLG
jgi:acetylornithine deacetylase/succinyl-diaminopimelate desuccinylase-like protein